MLPKGSECPLLSSQTQFEVMVKLPQSFVIATIKRFSRSL
jgi:hypothetical protein